MCFCFHAKNEIKTKISFMVECYKSKFQMKERDGVGSRASLMREERKTKGLQRSVKCSALLVKHSKSVLEYFPLFSNFPPSSLLS